MITGIILASGYSRRMGRNKLLIEIEGVKVVERVIRAAKESSLDRIILIYREEEVGNIGRSYGVETLFNPRANLGQAEGVKLGVVESGPLSDYMFLVADQPFITAGLIDELIREYKQAKSAILVPYYNGQRGMPTIISSTFRQELLSIEGDKGARDIVRENSCLTKSLYIGDKRLGIDIDEPIDLEKLDL